MTVKALTSFPAASTLTGSELFYAQQAGSDVKVTASQFFGPPTPESFGAVGNGIANDTTAVQAFLTSLRDGGIGEWNGTYLVNESLLLQPSSSSVSTIGPTIYGNPTFIAAGVNNQPILRVYNNHVSSFTFYVNVQFGNLTFTDTTGQVSPLRDGFQDQGCFQMKVGVITGNTLSGSPYSHSTATVAGDPDAYESAFLAIDGIRSITCGGPAIKGFAEATVGFIYATGPGPTGTAANLTTSAGTSAGSAVLTFASGPPSWIIPGITVSDLTHTTVIPSPSTVSTVNTSTHTVTLNNNVTGAGVISGDTIAFGTDYVLLQDQGMVMEQLSIGGNYGWGVHLDPTLFGTLNRIRIYAAELDSSQYGVWIGSGEDITIDGLRMNVGPQTGDGALAWPWILYKIGGQGSQVNGVSIRGLVRINPNVVLSAPGGGQSVLGTLVDLSSDGNVNNVDINLTINDNSSILFAASGALAVPLSRIVTNIPSNVINVRIIINGIIAFDSGSASYALVKASTSAVSIPGATGFEGSGSLLSGWSVVQDPGEMLNGATTGFLIPGTGWYNIHFHGYIPIGGTNAVTINTKIRAIITTVVSGNASNILTSFVGAADDAAATGVKYIEMNALSYLSQGDLVGVMMSATGLNGTAFLNIPLAASSDNLFWVRVAVQPE